jgi:hypothetical protein
MRRFFKALPTVILPGLSEIPSERNQGAVPPKAVLGFCGVKKA